MEATPSPKSRQSPSLQADQPTPPYLYQAQCQGMVSARWAPCLRTHLEEPCLQYLWRLAKEPAAVRHPLLTISHTIKDSCHSSFRALLLPTLPQKPPVHTATLCDLFTKHVSSPRDSQRLPAHVNRWPQEYFNIPSKKRTLHANAC